MSNRPTCKAEDELAKAQELALALTEAVDYLRDMDGILCSCDVDGREDCGFHMTIDALDRRITKKEELMSDYDPRCSICSKSATSHRSLLDREITRGLSCDLTDFEVVRLETLREAAANVKGPTVDYRQRIQDDILELDPRKSRK